MARSRSRTRMPIWSTAAISIIGSALVAEKRGLSLFLVWLLGEEFHRPFEPGERRRKHPPVHQLLDDADGLTIAPDFLGLGVEPDAFRIDVGHALDPHRARLLVEVLDRAARLQDFVGAHGRVADEDHLVVVSV